MSFKRCIILLADGARPDVLEELIAQGRLPNIKRYFADDGFFGRAVTAFPSTTGPAHIPFLTGCLPATCNIPGIRWFDRERYSRYGHGSMISLGQHGRYRSYVGIETFLINSDMRDSVRTVFEIVPKSYSIFNSINRGVGRCNLTKITRIGYWYYAHLTDRWNLVDEAALKKTLKAIQKDFKFLFVVFPGIDEYSHLGNPRCERTLKQYEFMDQTVECVAGVLKKQGRWNDTLLWVVSDHGLTPTHTHFCVNTFLESRNIRTFYFPLVYRKGCAAANMVSGNGMTHIYFKRPDGWHESATIEDIEKIYPGLLDELLDEPAVDILAARDSGGRIVVRTKRGRARIKLDGDDVSYMVEGGADPFGYNFSMGGMTLPSRDFLVRTFDTDYPDAPYQLAHIFLSPRCGDVVISATPGYDLRLKYESPEHKSSHGSLHREHMIVPVMCNAGIKPSCMRTVDVFPTYLNMLGHVPPEGIDGKFNKSTESTKSNKSNKFNEFMG